MLTYQSTLRVEVLSRGQRVNLLRHVKHGMSLHDMLREDLCHLSASQCHFWGERTFSKVKVKLSVCVYSALHRASCRLVDYVHVRTSMQIACKVSTRPILHSSDQSIGSDKRHFDPLCPADGLPVYLLTGAYSTPSQGVLTP